MKRVLTITSDDFYTGISAGAHVDRGGLFAEADGVNVFVDTTASSVNAGLLQTCSAPTDITSGIAGIPVASAVDAINSQLWYGTTSTADSTIATISLTTDATPVSEFTSIRHLGTGMEIFQPSGGGTRHLYYFDVDAATITQSRLRRIDIDSGGPVQADVLTTLNFDQNIQGTFVNRPMIPFRDGLYFGHWNNVGSVRDDLAGGTIDTAADLDLPEDKLITALSEDGNFLVIGATSNFDLNRTFRADTRVYFWDTNQSSWTREWAIPDSHIISLRRVGDLIYAVCGTGLWGFNYQTRPFKIRRLDSSDLPSATTYAYANASDDNNNAVLFGGDLVGVSSYGEPMQGIGVNNVLHTPYADPSTNESATLVVADARFDRLFVGTGGPGLYRYNINTGGSTGVTADTVYIPLSEPTHIQRVEIITGEPLASGDSLNIDLQSDEDVAATDWGTMSFASHGAVQRVNLKNTKRKVENLKIIFNFNGGNVKIKRINVYGTREPVAPRV